MRKTVFITGSTRGIGRVCAFIFANNGYDVILHGKKETRQSGELLKAIKAISAESKIFYFDVSSRVQTEKTCRRIIAEYKKIDVLINNAGIARDRTLMKMSFKEWDDVIRTNLYGTFGVTKEILPSMIENGFGRIINVSSIMGITGNFGQTNYCASKAALLGFTKALAKEVSVKNVTVNAVCPGLVATEMTTVIPKEYLEQMIEKIPMKRMAKPQEIGEILLFLASEKSSYISGAIIDVNGGWF